MQSVTISVVIPAYNCQEYVARAIDSVLNQTCPVGEIVIVDDGSTDNTAQVVKGYGDRVCYMYQENAGVSAARNAGIKAAKGDWIAFLDADDEWLPDKIEIQTQNLITHPELAWTTGNYLECLCDEERRAEHTALPECAGFLKGAGFFESYFRAIQVYQWGHTDCMLIQKKVFDAVGTFDTNLPIAEDIDLWLRIAYHYPTVGFSAIPLAIHHLSSENSLMKQARITGLYADFIQRHIELSRKEGMLEQFQPAAAFMMRRWIRSMLFKGKRSEIRELLRRFPRSFSVCYRVLIYGLTVFPRLTAGGLRCVSRIVRALRLRRRVTRRPS